MIETYIKEVEIDGIKEQRLYTKIENLHEWEMNYDLRATGPEGFKRVKSQITDLTQYKPLLVTSDGVVIGGNTRLRAFKEMGYTEIWISILNVRNKDDLLKYNISDNDNVSIYNESGLANLLSDYELNLEDYAVDFDEPTVIADITKEGNTSDPQEPKMITCPNCKTIFNPKEVNT